MLDEAPSGGEGTIALLASGADGIGIAGLGIGTVGLLLLLLHARLITLLIMSLFLIALLLLLSHSLANAANLFRISSLTVLVRGMGLDFADFRGSSKGRSTCVSMRVGCSRGAWSTRPAARGWAAAFRGQSLDSCPTCPQVQHGRFSRATEALGQLRVSWLVSPQLMHLRPAGGSP